MATGSAYPYVDDAVAEDEATREQMDLAKTDPSEPPFIPMEDTDLDWTPPPSRRPGPTELAWGD